MVARLLLFPINATSISGLESLPHQQPACLCPSFEANVICSLPLSLLHPYEPAEPRLSVAHHKPSLHRLYARANRGPHYTPSRRSHNIVTFHLLVLGTGQASIRNILESRIVSSSVDRWSQVLLAADGILYFIWALLDMLSFVVPAARVSLTVFSALDFLVGMSIRVPLII